jgi:hypothetical protein
MVSYNPHFNPPPWVDGVDTVQAAGNNGFNKRFQDIVTEFGTLSQVIAQINASIVIVPPTATLTFAPSFFPNLTNAPWTQNNGIATMPSNLTGVDGWMPLQLPDGTQMQTMTVIGSKSGSVGSFQVQLVQQSLSDGTAHLLLAIPLGDQSDGSFQVTGQVAVNLNQVNNSANKYLVTARIVGATVGASASLIAIQILTKRT